MCFNSAPKVDTTIQDQMRADAAKAREDEDARQARIKAGKAQLDTAFGQFDDNFYNQRGDAYLDFHQPTLNDQFTNAKEQLTFALARAGTLNSSMAADKQADITKKYNLQKGQLVSGAANEVANAKAKTASEKNALLTQLNATGDNERVNADALSRSQSLFAAQPSYNPLGDIFAGIAGGIGNAAQASKDKNLYNTYFNANGTGKEIA